jgi:hypothetical protein
MKLAGNRPGNAVFFYNDTPACLNRRPLDEARTGHINVLRYADRPLFAEVQSLIDVKVKPAFPDCDVMRVQLAELPPGSTIEPHRDTGILALIHRLHVPIVTHKGVIFYIGHEEFFLREGFLYDLNNVIVHAVRNTSEVMRVHLMIDMLPNTIARTRYFDSEDAIIAAVAA